MIGSQPQTGNSDTWSGIAERQRRRIARVTVAVPARLHVGFIDLNGELGRRFGSLGIAIDRPQTRLSLAWDDVLSVRGPDAERALCHLEQLARKFQIEPRLRLTIDEAIPEHVGLGSGTQLSLATGIAFCRLHGIQASALSLARLLERGARSSIGIGSFEQGGVILDGGRGDDSEPPPVLSRLPFPEDWRILLIFDNERRGLHGAAEVEAFHRLPIFPAAWAAHLCRLVLMVALPALLAQDIERFGGAVAELQRAIGDHFAPVQGDRFMSPMVAEVIGWLEAQGICGVGQSSWGPTGFAILPSQSDADAVARSARRRWPENSGLTFVVTQGRNRGGDITLAPAQRS